MIHNMFNEDLLTKCKEPQFKGQHIELVPLPTIINEEEEYEVKDVRNRLATKPVMLKVHNVKLSFDIWLVLYMYFILYS